MKNRIRLASFDEAAAADGWCPPLEQIADASGIAVGGTVLQMTRSGSEPSHGKVLITHSKSLTPAHSRIGRRSSRRPSRSSK